jgi:predicted enzyme related to lactoylglutathione lyase
MKIALVSIFVSDPLEAFRFYTQVLGFVEQLYMPEAYLAIVASPEEPQGTGLMLEPNNNPIASTYQQALYAAGLPAMVFGVADIQAEYERLTAAGVTFTQPPTQESWGKQAILEDGFGNLIQLHQA